MAAFGVGQPMQFCNVASRRRGTHVLRPCVRRVRRRLALSSSGRLPSTPSAAARATLFESFIGTTRLSDFSRPYIAGVCSSELPGAARGPEGLRAGVRPPRFRHDPFIRDGVLDLGRASAPRIAAPHMSPSMSVNISAPADLRISRLNSPPHMLAVYASLPASPPSTQHSLPGGRYPLPGPDFHRLDRTSFPGAPQMTQMSADDRCGTAFICVNLRNLRIKFFCALRACGATGDPVLIIACRAFVHLGAFASWRLMRLAPSGLTVSRNATVSAARRMATECGLSGCQHLIRAIAAMAVQISRLRN